MKIFKQYLIIIFFGIIILFSYIFNHEIFLKIGGQFYKFFIEMIFFFPLVFVLVGLIDVWFPKEIIEKHIGEESGIKGIFWVIILSMFQAGPLYGAFPVAYLLWQKGASIRNIFIYLGAFSTIKISLLTFEIGFMGIKFSLLRTLVTLPIFIGIALIIERYLKNKHFEIYLPKGG